MTALPTGRSAAITPVVLAGGGGSRLWPMSTPATPKQFCALTGEHSLMHETLARVKPRPGDSGSPQFAAPIIVGSQRHRQRLAGELGAAGFDGATVMLEPSPRNTAPAIAAAAHSLAAASQARRLMLVLASDHHIADIAAFNRAIEAAGQAACAGRLVVFGISPTHAETGFGYIRRGKADGTAFAVDRFVEKPPLELAREYVASGEYDWNAGIFMFRADAIIAALARHAPDVLKPARRAVDEARHEGGAIMLASEAFRACPSISIDDAVMTRSDHVSVVPVAMGWSDVGSWAAIRAIGKADADGNILGGRVLARGTTNALIRADAGIVAAIGMSDVAIVKSGDAVLVARLERSQDVRAIEEAVAALSAPRAREGVGAAEFGPAGARLCQWMRASALPLWAEQGWDHEHGGFREALGFDGKPCPEPFRRVRVQARQIYAFAAAHLMGWPGPALDLARRGFEHLVSNAWLAGGGFAHKLDVDGSVVDETRDAYDHAFVLLALAWLYRASGSGEVLAWARRTLAWLDAVLIDPVHGGYREAVPDALPRRANPHMHLLEALLALYDATRDTAYLDRADGLVRLFRQRFCDGRTASVREYFDTDWTPVGGKQGRIREPGHHFEWAWLLDAHETRLGGANGKEIAALTRFADRHGTSRDTGLVHDLVDSRGAVISTCHRLWCQTEAIRARLMLAGRGAPGEAKKAAALAEAVFRFHFDLEPQGLWRDRVDHAGGPVDAVVPASTLYHLMTLIWDLETRLAAAESTR